MVTATITPPDGGTPITVTRNVTVAAKSDPDGRRSPAHDRLGPEDLVAVPAGRAAAVHAGDVGGPGARHAGLDQRDVRHPHGHVVAGRRVGTRRAERRAGLQDQQCADGDPRRRLGSRPVPALRPGRHRQADRPDEGDGPQHDPARRPPHAGRLVSADGRRRHPGQRRLPVLRLLGEQQLHERRRPPSTSTRRRHWARSSATTRRCSASSGATTTPTTTRKPWH